MKKKSFKKGIIVLFGGLVTFSILAIFSPAEETLRVGMFDSRAVAIAYARSGTFGQYMGSLKEKLKKAKEEGDEKLVKELETLGPAMQQVLHQQGFSIASVADILEKVKAELPKIAEDAGVDIIVSKWEVVYKDPSIKIVDVTSHLVMLFNPEENTLKTLEDLRKQNPIPLLELLLEIQKER